MKNPQSKIKSVVILLLLLCLGVMSFIRCGGKPVSPAGQPGADESKASAETSEVSDLDQPVEKLMSAVCEHNILQYTCDECRYEVGVVKVPESLFDASTNGTLRKEVLDSREMAAGKESNGEVKLNENKSVYMSPRASGVVKSILVDLGSRVAAGQVLFEVDSPEFRQAKADFVRASASLELANATEQRESDLFERKISARKNFLEAQSALKTAEAEQRAAAGILLNLGLTTRDLDKLASLPAESQMGAMPVRAPFSGIILERSLNLGAQVQPGDRNMLLADTSNIWVQTSIYESDIGGILDKLKKTPIEAEVTVTAYPERIFKGKVEQVGGTIDEFTRSTQARVVVENPDNLLRAGMFAKVRLMHSMSEKVLALPDEAILQDEGRSFVFVHVDGPYYIRRPVMAGPESGCYRPVSGGVKAGDIVVMKGAFLLKSDVLRAKMGAGCAD